MVAWGIISVWSVNTESRKQYKLTIRDYVPCANSTFTAQPHKTLKDWRYKSRPQHRENLNAVMNTRNIRIQNVNSIHIVAKIDGFI